MDSVSKSLVVVFLLIFGLSNAQQEQPKKYIIKEITISGVAHLNRSVLVNLSGLNVGQEIEIPGTMLSKAIKKLWKEGYFDDVNITITKTVGNNVYLNYDLREKPRLSRFSFRGIKKSEMEDLRAFVKLYKGKIVSENMLMATRNSIRNHFVQKGYLNVVVKVAENEDVTKPNRVILDYRITKNEKVKIGEIVFKGNRKISSSTLRKAMQETKQKSFWNVLHTSKYLEKAYEEDKQLIIELYNEMGYGDAQILNDTIVNVDDETINLEITIDEGVKYHIRNITWKGNTIYKEALLDSVLGFKKGAVYDQKLMDQNLFMNPQRMDISSLYLDRGYLFFNVKPVMIYVENDSIDIEMQIHEGKQAYIRNVSVVGNIKTNDHVILREVRTKPGMLFRRADIIRSVRDLSQLPFLDPAKLNVVPKPNPSDGSVDIVYEVVEKSASQFELSGGWGGGTVIGTLGLSFGNFSSKKLFQKGGLKEFPVGDGQTLSLRAQSNGSYYKSFNFSFIEPWLKGTEPRSLSLSAYHTRLNYSDDRNINITGASVGLGRRLHLLNDYMSVMWLANYKRYELDNYHLFQNFENGVANNLNFSFNLSYNSLDRPMFPRNGASISLIGEFAPPIYSSLTGINKEPNLSSQEKYKWLEYQKWKFHADWYKQFAGKFVFHGKASFGFLSGFNSNGEAPPFERFYMGGDGITSMGNANQFDGREIIPLRGYEFEDHGALNSLGSGGVIASKYTTEIRYPFVESQGATVWGLVFAEAGNNFGSVNEFKGLDLYKSAGVGLRINVPMIGTIGIDYGWRFDKQFDNDFTDVKNPGRISVTINPNIKGW